MEYKIVWAKEDWCNKTATVILLEGEEETEYEMSIEDFDKMCNALGYNEDEDDIREKWVLGKDVDMNLYQLPINK